MPENLRDFLTEPIHILGDKTLLELFDMETLEVLINPDSFADRSTDEINESAGDTDDVHLNYDFATIEGLVNFLTGQTVDLLSLHIDTAFTKDITIQAVPETLIASWFGIVNFSYHVDIVAELELGAHMIVGLDTKGFYLKPLAVDRPILEMKGGVRGEIALTGSITILPVAHVTVGVGVEAFGGLSLASPDPNHKVRAEDLFHDGAFDTSVFNIGIGLDLVLTLKGELGLIEGNFDNLKVGAEETKNIELYRYEVGGSQAGDESFALFREKMNDKARSMQRTLVFGPLAPIVGPIIDANQEGLQKAGDQIADWSKEKAGQAADWAKDRGGEVAAAGKKAADDIGRGLAGARDQFLRGLGDVGKAISNFVFGTWEEIEPTPRFTYRAERQGNRLIITWDEDAAHDYGVDPAANIIVYRKDGQTIVDGPDFVTNEEVATKYDKLRQRREYRRADVTQQNSYLVPGDVTEIWVTGTNHADQIIAKGRDSRAGTQDVTTRLVFFGMDDDDLLVGGAGNDELIGGRGDDRLLGGGGADVLRGNDHDDLLIGGDGRDELYGGGGKDTLDESADRGGFQGRQLLDGGSGIDVLLGSADDDDLVGGPDNDLLEGRAGDDDLRGDSGADVLHGGSGDDDLHGGPDDDAIYGEGGDDTIHGDGGDDLLYGDDPQGRTFGTDDVHGDAGNDALYGGAHNDFLYGGADADVVRGGSGHDHIYGANSETDGAGDGNDMLYGETGDDWIYGGPSGDNLNRLPISNARPVDYLDGGIGADHLFGQSGPDNLVGGEDDDLLDGGTENDQLNGVAGRDTLLGGPGADQIVASSSAAGGSTVDGGPGGGSSSSAARKAISCAAAAENDSVMGGGGDDEILGDPGNDILAGNEGRDTIRGGPDDDAIDGGDGDDPLLDGEGGADIIVGGLGSDRIVGGWDHDRLYGGFDAARRWNHARGQFDLRRSANHARDNAGGRSWRYDPRRYRPRRPRGRRRRRHDFRAGGRRRDLRGRRQRPAARRRRRRQASRRRGRRPAPGRRRQRYAHRRVGY